MHRCSEVSAKDNCQHRTDCCEERLPGLVMAEVNADRRKCG